MHPAIDHEEDVIRALLPWLSRQLGGPMKWLGKPGKDDYVSACGPARTKAQKLLDGEIEGVASRIAVEHTGIRAFPEQGRAWGAFQPLRAFVREAIRPMVPVGNRIDISVQPTCVAGITRRMVQEAIPALREYVTDWCKSIPPNPTRNDTIRGHLLEEPRRETFGGLEVHLSRSLWPGSQKATFGIACGLQVDTGLDECVKKALADKIQGKAQTYQLYREAGWKTLLVMELTDFQLASVLDVGESFRRVSYDMDMSSLDYVVLVDHTLGDPAECCWAHRDGSARTYEQQRKELCDCFDQRS